METTYFVFAIGCGDVWTRIDAKSILSAKQQATKAGKDVIIEVEGRDLNTPHGSPLLARWRKFRLGWRQTWH